MLFHTLYRGVIDRGQDTTSILIPANDFPYGTVTLENASYETREDEFGSTDLKLKVIRRLFSIIRPVLHSTAYWLADICYGFRAGLFGVLRVVYSTEEIDLISEALERRENLVTGYFERPITVPSNGDYTNFLVHASMYTTSVWGWLESD